MMVDTVTTPNRKVSSRFAAPQNPKRPPLLPSDADNNAPRRPKSREVSSRYLSSVSSTSTTSSSATSSSSSSNYTPSRRFPSPLVPRTVASTPAPAPAVIKRSQSVERGRRVSTPRPTTPGNAGDVSSAAAKMLMNSKRSLSVSFQGESYSMPISKAKPAPVANLSNVRKATPERRKAVTPMRDGRENSKPIDKQLWPARSMSGNSLTRSVDFTSERDKFRGSGSIVRDMQKSMTDERDRVTSEAKLKSVRLNDSGDLAMRSTDETSLPNPSDTSSLSSGSSSGVQECRRGGPHGIVVPARFWQETNSCVSRIPERPGSPASKNLAFKTMSIVSPKLNGVKKLLIDPPASSHRGVSTSRGQSSPLRGCVRPASPSRYVASSTSSPVRGTSPSRVGNRVGNTQLASNLSGTSSILSFAADARRGRVGENRIVDAHQLRLLYNKQLQWRFANARAEAAMLVKKRIAEKSLYNAWLTTARLRHSVKSKKIELQLLRQNLKMHSILKGQMLHLEDWDFAEKDHSSSLCGAIEALEASTVRLPVVGGARADIHNLEEAICSAVDVMQAMASSICNLLTKVEHVNSLASELASLTSNERASLDQCRELLSTLTAMQVKDCSLRTHLLQLKGVP